MVLDRLSSTEPSDEELGIQPGTNEPVEAGNDRELPNEVKEIPQKEKEMERGYSDEVANIAKSIGWKPKEDYKGDPEDWRGPVEFIAKTQEIAEQRYQEIKNLRKEMANLKKDVSQVKGQFSKQEQSKVDEQLSKIDKQIDERVEEGDDVEVRNLLKQRDELMKSIYAKSDKSEEPEGEDVQEIHPDIQTWVEANPWFNEDPDMAEYARYWDKQYQKQGIPLKRTLQKITEKVKAEFPEKFADNSSSDGSDFDNEPPPPKRQRSAVNDVVSGNRPQQRQQQKRYKVSDMSVEVQNVAKTMVGLGKFKTEQDYVDELMRGQ